MMDNTNLLELLRRWWLWLLCGAAIAGVAGWVAASHATPTYSANVKLLVGPINADFDTLRASGQLARTYAELATSRPVLRDAINRTGAQVTSTKLQDTGAVQARSNDITRVVSIDVEYGNGRTASQLANAIAQRITRLAALTPPQETAAIRSLLAQTEISRLSRRDQAAVSTAAHRSLGNSQSGQVEIVEPPQEPTKPVSPRTTLITALAALMGMLVVAIFIVLRESSRRGVSDERSLASLEVPPFLGALDVAVSRRGAAPLAVEVGPDAVVEAYRGVLTKIGFLDDHPRVRVLLVVDATDGRRSGVLAANLATVLADTHRRVLLIDANDVSGDATSALSLDGRPGYGEHTAGLRAATMDEALELSRIREFPSLCVLPRGTTPVTGRLDEGYAQRLLQRLRDEADVVIISGAPVHLSPGTLLWGRVADGTLLVIEAGGTSDERVQETIGSFGFVGANIAGTVLVRQRRRRGSSSPRNITMQPSEPVEERPPEPVGQV
jgi:capsular polysaccharide biosynthesis protein/Mrp family chromosome partitioning ATPase